MATLYTVRKVNIERTAQMDELARAAGALYSQVVVWFWRTKRHKVSYVICSPTRQSV
jgi:hypothetical protein